jgi:hypothetical protein
MLCGSTVVLTNKLTTLTANLNSMLFTLVDWIKLISFQQVNTW